MTAQINDKVFHRKVGYSLAGISGSGLFEPETHGIKPVSISTACWRGYFVEYAVEEERLLLTKTTLGLAHADDTRAEAGKGPPLFGVVPRKQLHWGWEYEGLREPVDFTGGLLLADGFIRELYVHMGFHPAWKYREVRELIFEHGHLKEESDRTSRMAELRARLSAKPLQPDIRTQRGEIEKWIEQSFSRDYTPKRIE
jgi:hypothetical protein